MNLELIPLQMRRKTKDRSRAVYSLLLWLFFYAGLSLSHAEKWVPCGTCSKEAEHAYSTLSQMLPGGRGGSALGPQQGPPPPPPAGSVLVIRIKFTAIPPSVPTKNEVMDLFHRTNGVIAFYRDVSYDQLAVTLQEQDITEILEMPHPSDYYSVFGLTRDARALATTYGYDVSAYSFVIVVGHWPNAWYGGIYLMENNIPTIHIENFSVDTVCHEMGHAVGLWGHAKKLIPSSTSDSVLIPDWTTEDYGDPFDVMGVSWSGFAGMGAFRRQMMGWLPSGRWVQTNQSASLRVYEFDNSEALQGTNGVLGVECIVLPHIAYTFSYCGITELTAGQPGILIHRVLSAEFWGFTRVFYGSWLLPRSSTGSPDATAPLLLNQTFDDPFAGLQLQVVGQGGVFPYRYLDIAITYPEEVPVGVALDLPDAMTNAITQNSIPWHSSAAIKHLGNASMQSGRADFEHPSTLRINAIGPGILSYWTKLACEMDVNFLRVLVNGREMGRLTGGVDWSEHGVLLEAGTNVVEWSYVANHGVGSMANIAWVDQVTLRPPDQRVAQNVWFAPPPTNGSGDRPIVLSAVASSGLEPTFELVSGSALLCGNILVVTNSGPITIRVSQPGNNLYAPAPDVPYSFEAVTSRITAFASSRPDFSARTQTGQQVGVGFASADDGSLILWGGFGFLGSRSVTNLARFDAAGQLAGYWAPTIKGGVVFATADAHSVYLSTLEVVSSSYLKRLYKVSLEGQGVVQWKLDTDWTASFLVRRGNWLYTAGTHGFNRIAVDTGQIDPNWTAPHFDYAGGVVALDETHMYMVGASLKSMASPISNWRDSDLMVLGKLMIRGGPRRLVLFSSSSPMEIASG